MSDWSEQGAVPVEEAAVDDPPTVDEVMEEQRRRDDLPDPSDDPDHQQVVDDAGTDAGAVPSDDAMTGQAVAGNMPAEARPDIDP
jgi:hypothetical protein